MRLHVQVIRCQAGVQNRSPSGENDAKEELTAKGLQYKSRCPATVERCRLHYKGAALQLLTPPSGTGRLAIVEQRLLQGDCRTANVNRQPQLTLRRCPLLWHSYLRGLGLPGAFTFAFQLYRRLRRSTAHFRHKSTVVDAIHTRVLSFCS